MRKMLQWTGILSGVFALLFTAALFLFDGGGASRSDGDWLAYIQSVTGLELSGTDVVSAYDTHGGFHGDGQTVVLIRCDDPSQQMEADGRWRKLPLSEAVSALAYGGHFSDGSGGGMIPYAENGYYFFIDRYADAADRYDASGIHGRYSYNYTLVLYDADEGVLCFAEMDT